MALKFKACINDERREIPAKRFSHYVDNVRFWFAVHDSVSDVGKLTVSHWDSGKIVCNIPYISRLAGANMSDANLGRAEIDKLVARVGAKRVASVLRSAES